MIFHPGTFVRLLSGEVRAVLSSNTIANSQQESGKLWICCFLHFGSCQNDFNVAQTCLVTSDFRHIPELVYLDTQKETYASEVESIIFIFWYLNLQQDFPSTYIQGMCYVYLCHYDACGLEINASAWSTFPSDIKNGGYGRIIAILHDHCLPRTIWMSIVALQETMWQMLGHILEKQGVFQQSTVRFIFLWLLGNSSYLMPWMKQL